MWIFYSCQILELVYFLYSDSSQGRNRFLSNEIRADGIKVILHQRICGSNNSCAIKEVKSTLNLEIKDRILRKAALLKKTKEDEVSESYKNEDGEINWCGEGRAIC